MPNQYWFRPKSYGYGAFPSTWEGWIVILVFAAIIAASAFYVVSHGEGMTTGRWIMWAIVLIAMTCAVTALSWGKTDGTWEWRGGGRGWFN